MSLSLSDFRALVIHNNIRRSCDLLQKNPPVICTLLRTNKKYKNIFYTQFYLQKIF